MKSVHSAIVWCVRCKLGESNSLFAICFHSREAIGYPIKAKAYFEGEPKVNCTLLKDTKETLACIKVPLCDT